MSLDDIFKRQTTFLDFTGCISRLQIGAGYPLKNPTQSRMSYTGKIKFGTCPFDSNEYRPTEEPDEIPSEIQISSVVKSQQRLLLITRKPSHLNPIKCLKFFSGYRNVCRSCPGHSPVPTRLLCQIEAGYSSIFMFKFQYNLDGVYKTNENVAPYISKSVEPLVHEQVPYTKEYFC